MLDDAQDDVGRTQTRIEYLQTVGCVMMLNSQRIEVPLSLAEDLAPMLSVPVLCWWRSIQPTTDSR